MNDLATQLRIPDARECLRQSHSIGGGEKFVDVSRNAWSPLSSSWGAFEKERNRHLKDLGNVLQSAGTDAVHSFLIFLHLLERQAECPTQCFLAHAQHHSTHAHAASYMLVDNEIDVVCHLCPQ